MFSPELTEGSAVQVLCGVSAGDKPLYFSWFKDGAPVPAELQVNWQDCFFIRCTRVIVSVKCVTVKSQKCFATDRGEEFE